MLLTVLARKQGGKRELLVFRVSSAHQPPSTQRARTAAVSGNHQGAFACAHACRAANGAEARCLGGGRLMTRLVSFCLSFSGAFCSSFANTARPAAK
jgi:hypothetical protein